MDTDLFFAFAHYYFFSRGVFSIMLSRAVLDTPHDNGALVDALVVAAVFTPVFGEVFAVALFLFPIKKK